ncbi:MAG: stalk domain-containing protein [Clostridia bacterium]|nr:stalk domain-containing protein [Clostridia bacterium]
MFKKWIALMLVIAMSLSLFTPSFAVGTDSKEDGYRNGFKLVAENSDSTGVAPDSSFMLYAKDGVSIQQLSEAFSIEGEPSPKIEETQKDVFRITPARNLLENQIYIMKLKVANETTWTFQTRARFKILGTIPGNQTDNVPVNSGIEIHFSHEDFEALDSFFEITPQVEGRFEKHKKAAVFVPKTLKEGTIYTVKIKKGIKIKNAEQGIDSDYVFSFETEKSSSIKKDTWKGYFSYNKMLFDYSPNSAPVVPVNFYINTELVKEDSINIKTGIYSYNDFNTFVSAYKKKAAVPEWASVSFDSNTISVDGLNKVGEFDQTFSLKENGRSRGYYISLPNPLPIGYYVLDSMWDDIRFQTFLQVTNTGIYVMKSTTKTLLWLNNLETKSPLEGASITLENGSTYTSDSKGIASFDTPEASQNTDWKAAQAELLKITTKEGVSSIIRYGYNSYMEKEQYWKYLFTDRNIYKPDDTVSLWGFVKNRYTAENISALTLELNKGYRSDSPVVTQNLQVKSGLYEAKLKLPMLEPGSYVLTVKHGESILDNTYLSIENYAKPSYKIEISKDKEAVFAGEEVTFNAKALFFEGTGVSNLKTNYFISDYSIGQNNVNAQGTTDVKGNLKIKYTPKASIGTQGEKYVNLNVRALLPESGEISESSTLRVFINDIHVNLSGEIKNQEGTLRAEVNKIVLDRLNNGTAKDQGDYLGEPTAGKTLTGTIYRNTWVEKEAGEDYDFINKVTHKRYTYDLVKTPVKEVSMVAGADGKAVFNFDAPEVKNAYYTAELKCQDTQGKNMEFSVYLGERIDYMDNPNQDTYFLDGGKENYSIGEEINLTLKKGKEAVPAGNTLFIKTQNGIRDFSISAAPVFSGKFEEQDAPNTAIWAVYFDGKNYVEPNVFNANYKIEDKSIVLHAKLNKDSYRPGEEAVVTIRAKDKNGKPVKAFVNASIVDEAFFKLSDQNVNTLAALYNNVYSGVIFTETSHEYSGIEQSRRFSGDDREYLTAVPASMEKADEGSGSSNNTVRENFRDTAHFETVQTAEDGTYTLKFKLPDNVTSWRITLSAISEDLHAGSDKVALNVTLPFFINYSMNTTYLEGDQPVIGVNAYGNGLKEDDLVMFEVSSMQNPALKVSAVGKAFERINIPLWRLSEGIYDLMIKATTNGEYTDAVKHTLYVVKSYYQIDRALYQKLAPGIQLAGGKSGNTRIIFQDKSRGIFLSELLRLYYTDGKRIDQKVGSQLAGDLIRSYFKDYVLSPVASDFSSQYYQKNDGGLSLLPYTESDLDLSAGLTPLVKDKVDLYRLKGYFNKVLEKGELNQRALALYGLASLKEPVLLELHKTTAVDNLNIKDWIILSLAYAELGELSKAEELFEKHILSAIEEQKPFYRVNTGADQDDILESTALAAVLASKLNMPQKNGLYEYCVKNNTKDILIHSEMLAFISQEINKYGSSEAKLTYTYNGKEKTVTLKNGETHSIIVPSQNLKDLAIKNVEGELSAVSIYKENVAGIDQLSKDISVKRAYFHIDGKPLVSNTLKQGDIIKVSLTWDIGPKALDGGYKVTDYLPSGLKPVENFFDIGWYYRNIDGQKVKFYIYNSPYWKDHHRVFEYYARVVSPGTYTAQGTIIQSESSKDVINTAKSEVITIDSSGEISTPIDPKGVKVEVDGKPVIFDVQPVVKSGRTLVPLRSIFEVLGAEVKWNAKTKTITALKGGQKVELTVNSKVAKVNGQQKNLDVPASIIGNRTVVPTRFISESLGAGVNWDTGKKTVVIKSR